MALVYCHWVIDSISQDLRWTVSKISMARTFNCFIFIVTFTFFLSLSLLSIVSLSLASLFFHNRSRNHPELFPGNVLGFSQFL